MKTMDHENLKHEVERLKTFSKWPLEFIKPEELAKLGFIHLNKNHPDEVKCVFCSIQISQWQPGDRPIMEHRIHSKKCPFLDGRDVGNVFFETDPRELFDLSPGTDVCGFYHQKLTLNEAEEKSTTSFSSSKSSDFITYESRLATFEGWPVPEIVSPERMAEAGFFYRGKAVLDPAFKDCVECFHCGQCLVGWEPTDDPWAEHEKHSSSCLFVQMVKPTLTTKKDESSSSPATTESCSTTGSCSTTFEPFSWLPKSKDPDCYCAVCLVNEPTVVLKPCKHDLCSLCVTALSSCPICRNLIVRLELKSNEK